MVISIMAGKSKTNLSSSFTVITVVLCRQSPFYFGIAHAQILLHYLCRFKQNDAVLSRYSRLVRRSKSKVKHVPTKCVSPVVIITIQAVAILCVLYCVLAYFSPTNRRSIHPRRKRKISVYAFTSVVYKHRFFLSIFTTATYLHIAVNLRSTSTVRRAHIKVLYTFIFFNKYFPDVW